MSDETNWSRRLAQHLGAEHMLVAAVKTGTAAQNADLVMYKFGHSNHSRSIDVSRPCLILIDGTGKSWLEIRDALRMWCDGYKGDGGDYLLRRPGTPCWAIGTKGDQVAFWLYTGNRNDCGFGAEKEKVTMLPVTSDSQYLRRVNEPQALATGGCDLYTSGLHHIYDAHSRETSLILSFIDSYRDPNGLNGEGWRPYRKLFYYPTGGY